MAQETHEEGALSGDAGHEAQEALSAKKKSETGRGAARIKRPPFASKAQAYGAAEHVAPVHPADFAGASPDAALSGFERWWHETGKMVAVGIV
ncbi:MAG: hypothetical protein RLN70_00430, partial [Rhodospirillaceae bacterium]